jgi:hypothetical protein
MTKRPENGRGLFYTRDSEGRSELAPPQYVNWARAEATKLGVRFAGTAEAIETMIARGVSADGDLFLDYGVSGNLLSRPGFDAFRQRALTDATVSHLFVPRRDRIARPDNPLDAMILEYELRTAGLTLVLMNGGIQPPIVSGSRIGLADLIQSLVDYESSGAFRRDLADKLIRAKIRLSERGYSIGGEPVYGFRRWLCSAAGRRVRELAEREVVKMPGHHVVWLPTAERELAVVRRILDLIETMPANRIAQMLNAEGVPSPKAGRTRTVNGVQVELSGLWGQNTVKNVATHPLLTAVWEYNKRSMGDQLRLTPAGPRALQEADYRPDGKKKTVVNPAEQRIRAPAPFEPIISAERHDRIRQELERRGRHLKGKARTRGESPNPLGGRVFDLNCGWPMYRYDRRGQWRYLCALYQNSEAKCCRHNVIDGPAATRFVLDCLRQRVLSPSALAKLKARLQELAASEADEDPAARRLAADQAELRAVRRKLQTVRHNMALAETAEERAATAAVFGELKGEEVRLEARANQPVLQRPSTPDEEVAAALAVLDRLAELADDPGADSAAVGRLVSQIDAKLYLRFREVEQGSRKVNVPAGGVLSFGSAPPPAPMYNGLTDRAIVRKAVVAGESASLILGHGALGQPKTGPEDQWSAKVQRVTRRCT